tara:strand:+ start:955 stop:1275 length:321 start_codon:yes stop_codon:yes gene_type:complete
MIPGALKASDKDTNKRVPVGEHWRIRNAEFRDVDSAGQVWEIQSFIALYNYYPDMITAFKALDAMAKKNGYKVYEPGGPGIVEKELAMIWIRAGEFDHDQDQFVPD